MYFPSHQNGPNEKFTRSVIFWSGRRWQCSWVLKIGWNAPHVLPVKLTQDCHRGNTKFNPLFPEGWGWLYIVFIPHTSCADLEALAVEIPVCSYLHCESSHALQSLSPGPGARTSTQLPHTPMARAQGATPNRADGPWLPGSACGNWSKASEGTCLGLGKGLEQNSSVLPPGCAAVCLPEVVFGLQQLNLSVFTSLCWGFF